MGGWRDRQTDRGQRRGTTSTPRQAPGSHPSKQPRTVANHVTVGTRLHLPEDVTIPHARLPDVVAVLGPLPRWLSLAGARAASSVKSPLTLGSCSVFPSHGQVVGLAAFRLQLLARTLCDLAPVSVLALLAPVPAASVCGLGPSLRCLARPAQNSEAGPHPLPQPDVHGKCRPFSSLCLSLPIVKTWKKCFLSVSPRVTEIFQYLNERVYTKVFYELESPKLT